MRFCPRVNVRLQLQARGLQEDPLHPANNGQVDLARGGSHRRQGRRQPQLFFLRISGSGHSGTSQGEQGSGQGNLGTVTLAGGVSSGSGCALCCGAAGNSKAKQEQNGFDSKYFIGAGWDFFLGM